MTELIKEPNKKIMLMIDRDEEQNRIDYYLSKQGLPIVYFSENREASTDNVFLEKTVINHNPQDFLDCLEFFSHTFFQVRSEAQAIRMVKIMDEGIRHILKSHGIIENYDHEYVIENPFRCYEKGMVR